MKAKRLLVLLIGLAFFIALITSCLFIFSIKSVKTEYNVSESFNETEVYNTLNEFNGKNLLFFNEEEVYVSLSKFTNLKVLSVKKTYPNLLEVKVSERLVSYALLYGDSIYLLDNEGFIISEQSADYELNNIIKITLADITAVNLVPGSKLSTSFNELFYSSLEIAETALSDEAEFNSSKIKDCVKEIKISNSSNVKLALFSTCSGVDIRINKPDEDGVAKAQKGFKKYHELAIDYYKTYDTIDVTKLKDSNEIVVKWTSGEIKR